MTHPIFWALIFLKNMERQFRYRSSVISYQRFGKGPQPVICFHGYGEQAGVFSFFEKEAGDRFSFFAFDIPFHGKTEWNEGLQFTINDLLKIINCETYNRQPVLMGFSLGGRVALSLFEAAPDKFCKLILLAPDGLKINFWYWLSTQTLMGRRIFSFTMKHPGWFFGFLKLMNKLKLVNASIFKFVKFYIDNEEMRTLLYKRWICLRKLKPNLKKIKKAINETQTTVRLMYGKHDRIILPVVGERFRKGIEDYCTITIIAAGHQVLHEKHVAEILNLILD